VDLPLIHSTMIRGHLALQQAAVGQQIPTNHRSKKLNRKSTIPSFQEGPEKEHHNGST
jgi:hypothetical protein